MKHKQFLYANLSRLGIRYHGSVVYLKDFNTDEREFDFVVSDERSVVKVAVQDKDGKSYGTYPLLMEITGEEVEALVRFPKRAPFRDQVDRQVLRNIAVRTAAMLRRFSENKTVTLADRSSSMDRLMWLGCVRQSSIGRYCSYELTPYGKSELYWLENSTTVLAWYEHLRATRLRNL